MATWAKGAAVGTVVPMHAVDAGGSAFQGTQAGLYGVPAQAWPPVYIPLWLSVAECWQSDEQPCRWAQAPVPPHSPQAQQHREQHAEGSGRGLEHLCPRSAVCFSFLVL